MSVRRLTAFDAREIGGLADVLVDCVEGGASVSFMAPLSREKAEAYWREIAESARRGERIVVAAEDDGALVGTVQVVLAQPENQPHRGDLSKMLVHRRARKRGFGAALLQAAEAAARAAGKSLLVLDTASADAERLYASGGWVRCGLIPDYALWPGGGFCDTVVYYKKIA
ncbi:MAG: GNAT family N-acetyltransferase [Hyphomonadaceae bacterium]|nr:GNAT family N-acetyltransferase [Hyphomonadaceae bacterium]